jgi:hypothetical protein
MAEQVDFAPRSRLLDWFKEGWRLLPAHPYQPGDWAVLVYMPIYPKPVPIALMERWAKRFEQPAQRPLISNCLASKQGRRGSRVKKLSAEIIADIRRHVSAGEKQWRVAQRFGVARSTVSIISAREASA